MEHKWAIVTGANGGIGKEITKFLAVNGFSVIMACRNRTKSTLIRDAIATESGNEEIEVLHLDLASETSIRTFVHEVIQRKIQLRLLINNAGIMSQKFETTPEGLELDMGVNYVGTRLLTELLIPTMTPLSQILNTLSCTCKIGRLRNHFLQPNPHTFGQLSTYADSKLALLIYSSRLAQRLEPLGIAVNAIDPGIVNTGILHLNRWFDPLTDILFRPFTKTPKQGARPTLLAIAIDPPQSGQLFRGNKHTPLPKNLLRTVASQKTWDQAEILFEKFLKQK